ncbi:LytTR family DNA-binding domain-containing protein [Caulobacter sp. RL271]|jgi:DNA-binding LytR/AlgR family response regulator|uniref:LytTR family transcriptional regulator n=1 Tax=Caulobacter segnis TaxID=88688 RepID=A0ABY4ZST3_9CAUL|nr:LytTR family DNA-binding domain-containing protein [Caulobacter segnis]USQ95689.1 LytTR family transcriptional regulator [Caulobacter segnis]
MQDATAIRRHRWAVDLAVLVAIGLLMGFLGPFDSERMPAAHRYGYWMSCMVGGGLIGIGIDSLLKARVTAPWRRAVLVSLLMTPLVSAWVLTSAVAILGAHFTPPNFLRLPAQVLPIALAVMLVRALVWRPRPTRIETRTIVAPPTPDAETTFRKRLSARRRGARLIAIEAHDHYLKVHTDAGAELITLRFADALAELDKAHGWRVHRSWWIAAEAVEDVRWRRGTGEARLAGGLAAPVSRTYAPVLKEAGWRP